MSHLFCPYTRKVQGGVCVEADGSVRGSKSVDWQSGLFRKGRVLLASEVEVSTIVAGCISVTRLTDLWKEAPGQRLWRSTLVCQNISASAHAIKVRVGEDDSS